MTPEKDPLTRYRRRCWPDDSFPAWVPGQDRHLFVLWHYIRACGVRIAAREARFRPPLALRLAVNARRCALAARTAGRALRLMLILDGTWPTRAAFRARLRRWRSRRRRKNT